MDFVEVKTICNGLRPAVAVFSIEAERDFVLRYGRVISVVNKKI